MRYLFAFLILAACSCRASLPYEHRTATGVARANDLAQARSVGIMSELFLHRTAAQLGVPPKVGFVVHYDDSVEGPNGIRVWRDRRGKVIDRRIELGGDSRDSQDFCVAHEMVHWNLQGVWTRLPVTVEEGLADYIALHLVPEFRDERERELRERLSNLDPELIDRAWMLEHATREDTAPEVRSAAYAIGFDIVRRLGVDELRRLCALAESSGHAVVPREWFNALPPNVAPTPSGSASVR
jgi:hypothetical protein